MIKILLLLFHFWPSVTVTERLFPFTLFFYCFLLWHLFLYFSFSELFPWSVLSEIICLLPTIFSLLLAKDNVFGPQVKSPLKPLPVSELGQMTEFCITQITTYEPVWNQHQIQLRCPLHLTTRFGNHLLRLLILCKMGCKVTSALQWFCLLLFLTKNLLSYPITRPLLIQTPWVSYPLFLHHPWSLLHSAFSVAHGLGSLNLMRNRYKLQFFQFYYLYLCWQFLSRSGKSTIPTYNNFAVDFSL